VLFNEPKLLKAALVRNISGPRPGFSALQRAEIAEMWRGWCGRRLGIRVSVLFNEPKLLKCIRARRPERARRRFSALQRAEIAEIRVSRVTRGTSRRVSVLFNEPKLLKLYLYSRHHQDLVIYYFCTI